MSGQVIVISFPQVCQVDREEHHKGSPWSTRGCDTRRASNMSYVSQLQMVINKRSMTVKQPKFVIVLSNVNASMYHSVRLSMKHFQSNVIEELTGRPHYTITQQRVE